jgi:hypothetical protein
MKQAGELTRRHAATILLMDSLCDEKTDGTMKHGFTLFSKQAPNN